MNLGLGADVDAARWLIEDQELGIVGEPLAEHDLLLIAARKAGRDLVDGTCLDAESRDALKRHPPLRSAVDESVARQRPKRRERKIVQDAHPSNQALRAAIFRHVGDAVCARSFGRVDPHALTVEPNLTRFAWRHAEQSLGEFAAART